MNLQDSNPDLLKMPDVQSSEDTRHIAIELVGIRSVRYPVMWHEQGQTPQGSVAEFSMMVSLPAEQKGTHMSRFIAWLEDHSQDLGAHNMVALYQDMLTRLHAPQGELSFVMPWFVHKTAPVSGLKSMMDYQMGWTISGPADLVATELEMLVPVTSLCPCSKAISDYGAHNQRSHVTLRVKTLAAHNPIGAQALIDIAEKQASSELYGMLKRVDEKQVTERAYDNPKFVEDLARDVAAGLIALKQQDRIAGFCVKVENFESIHNHSAFAQISG
jgi:GTP cyclohydrolase IB